MLSRLITVCPEDHLHQIQVRMADGQIPKDLLDGELVQGHLPRGRPQLWYKEICKWDLKALGMDLSGWGMLMSERSAWGSASWPLPIWRDPCPAGWGEEEVLKAAKSGSWTGAGHCIYLQCGRDGLSRIGLLSYTRCCSKSSIQSTLL